MTTLLVVYAIAVMVLFGIFAGIPMWMIRRHPDTAPYDKMPAYLRADWEDLPAQAPVIAGQRPGR